MEFNKAIDLKNMISAEFLRNHAIAPTTKKFSMGSRSPAAAIETQAEIASEINGVGIVKKPTGEAAVRILLKSAAGINRSYLSKFFGVAAQNLLTEQVGAIRFKGLQDRTRPIYPGLSIGHYKVTAGTLGCFVKDSKGTKYLLSNNHVLANSNDAFDDDAILQPGPLDGGRRKANRIGGLKYFVPLQYDAENTMDAALARVDKSIETDSRIAQTITISGTDNVEQDMRVEKYGRTTGHTTGTITTTNLDLDVDFEDRTLQFVDQFEVKGFKKLNAKRPMFCDAGDSGSLILEIGSAKAVGLLFAGADDGTTFATPIKEVLAALSVTLL